MTGWKNLGFALAVPLLIGASRTPAAQHDVSPGAPPAFTGEVDVLTYNVHGLPWPLVSDRTQDYAAIADRLRHLRAQGRQPAVIVFQEAFGADAKAMGRSAGYRYSVAGPGADAHSSVKMRAGDAAFARGASWWLGENGTKLVDSGLQLVSDYPIERVRTIAYPDFACAGFDCLSNKGALLVTLRLPDGRAVDVLNTHLNSRGSSGVSDARSLTAFRRQLAILSNFIAAKRDPANPLIVAGDFNDGVSAQRGAALRAEAKRWDARTGDAIDELTRARLRAGQPLPRTVRAILKHNVDRHYFIDGKRWRLAPSALHVPFGPDPAGRMLSDHIGYTVTFRLSPTLQP